jgi:transmembrane sensor
MSPPRNTPKQTELDRSVTDQAAEWLAILSDESCGADERRAFAQWLTRANTHVDEFLKVSTLTRRLQSAGNWPAIDVDRLVADARAEPNVVGLVPARAEETQLSLPQRRRPTAPGYSVRARVAFGVCAVSAIALVTLFATPFLPWGDTHDTFTTMLGELRSVTLEDGSIVQLNSRSTLRTSYTREQRVVELVAGEAMFRVTKDTTRPFKVTTSAANIVALGTQFNVDARANGTVVTVIEGRVSVSESSVDSRGGSIPVPILSAGEQLTVQPRMALAKTTRVDPEKVTGWTARRLYFDDTPLAQAAREFSNYSARIIRIDDPALRERRISGTFDSSDPGALVEFLKRYGDTTVTPTAEGWTLRRSAGGAAPPQ